jgi:glycosyltransferase involved in cell wall biosynthesis
MRVPMADGDLTQSLQQVVARLLTWLEEDGRRDAVRGICREVAESHYDWPQVAKRLECLYAAASSGRSTALAHEC